MIIRTMIARKNIIALVCLTLVIALAAPGPASAGYRGSSATLLPQDPDVAALSHAELGEIEGEFLTYLVVNCVMSVACRQLVTRAVTYAYRLASAYATYDYYRSYFNF